MANAKTRTCIASFAALALVAAMVVSVFADAHASIASPAPVEAADPCPEHMPMPMETVSNEGCESICDSADLDHFLGLTHDRMDLDPVISALVQYDRPDLHWSDNQADASAVFIRGPPGSDLYLTTHRLRI